MSNPRFTVGREPERDIVLADGSVSRRHAELTFLPGGRLLVVDCHSTFGTAQVVGEKRRPISQAWVPPDAVLEFGGVLMSVAEVLQALRERHPSFEPGELQVPAEDGLRPAADWPRGARLVRCACRRLKATGSACAVCGR